MKNGTIYCWESKPTEKGILKIVSDVIAYITKSKYTHVAVVLNDNVYESTIRKLPGDFLPHNGVQKTTLGYDMPDEVWEPIRDLTDPEVIHMVDYAEACISLKIPYSIMKLIILAIVYPTRPFWNKLGWFPFESQLKGEVCSEFVDQDFKAANIELIPNRMEEFTAPVDVINSGFFKKVG